MYITSKRSGLNSYLGGLYDSQIIHHAVSSSHLSPETWEHNKTIIIEYSIEEYIQWVLCEHYQC